MTRTGDVALPSFSPPGGHTFSRVAAHLHIGLERLPTAAYTWDDEDPDVTWDDTTPERVWDAPFIGGGMTHTTCDFHACVIDAGHLDDDGLFGPGRAVVTLANPAGEYSLLDASGRLVYAAVGRRVQILGEADNLSWWLFSGRVTSWDENPDGTVTVTAHDGFAQLAQDTGTEWTPGSLDQTVAQRVTSILSTWAYTDPVALAVTDVRMGNPPTERSPLEECQVTALSDGGVLFGDADGRLTYRARTWLAGRADQTVVRVFSDNVCDGPVVVWDLETVTDDALVASQVRLDNYETPAKTAVATAATNPWTVPYVYSHPDADLWHYQTDGDRLATDLLALRTNQTARFGFALYLHDPGQDLWRTGIDLRIGDRVRVVRHYTAAGGDTGTLDVTNVVTSIGHEITPESWVTTVATSRVVTYAQPVLWDAAAYTWDDTNPLNVWSY